MSTLEENDFQEKIDMKTRKVETTIGDLICAISEAAKEAYIDNSELARLTQYILAQMLKRYTH